MRTELSRDELIKEAWIASIGILAVLGILKHLGQLVGFIGQHAFTVVAAIELYVPVFMLEKRGVTRETLGLTFARWREDLTLLFALAVIVTVPFAIGHHYWQTMLFHRPFHPRLPDDLITGVLTQVFVVALAEEVYFRGYLQERLARIWPAKRTLFGVPFGAAILVASAVFALAHFVGEYRFERLGPFFPALVFGLLRQRTGTLIGAIGFHAYCNILGEVLWACYRG